MCIERGTPIKDIQKGFSEMYPFLKIEVRDKKQSSKLVPDGNGLNDKQLVDISSCRTVAELEEDFKRFLNLPIQLFRKAGNLWIETSLTHDWTLDQQNKEGELFSSLYSNFTQK